MTGLNEFLAAEILTAIILVLQLAAAFVLGRGRAERWPIIFLALALPDYGLVLLQIYQASTLLILKAIILGLALWQARAGRLKRLLLVLRRTLQARKKNRLPWYAMPLPGMLALGAICNLLTPPGSWDALTYHLEFPLQWIEEHRIFNYTAFGDLSPPYYPALPGLLYGPLLATSGFALADSLPLLFWLLFYQSTRRILRMQGMAAGSASLLSFLICMQPLYFSGTLLAEADLLLAAIFSLALYNCLIWQKYRKPVSFFYFCLATGLLMTAKTTGILYALALLFWGILPELKKLLEPNDWHGKRLCPSWQLALPGLALASFFYIRNWIVAGNPLYPANILRWPGLYNRAFYAAHPFHKFSFYDFLTDPHWAPLLLLCLPVLTVLAQKKTRTFALYFFILPILLFAFFYFFSPYRQLRQLAPLGAALVPVIAIAWSGPGARAWRSFLTFAVLINAFGAGSLRMAELYTSAFAPEISLTEFSRATLKFYQQGGVNSSTALVFAGLALLAGLALFLAKQSQKKIWLLLIFPTLFISRLQSFQAYQNDPGPGLFWAYLSQMPVSGCIAVSGYNAIAPLRGPALDRCVYFAGDRKKEAEAAWFLLQKSHSPPEKEFELMKENARARLYRRK